MKILTIILCGVFYNLTLPAQADVDGHVSPIIGILSQEVNHRNLIAKRYNATSYISASYVKYIEGAGGRVVPIWIGKNQAYYEKLLSKLNGVLFPGGDSPFHRKNGYSDAGEHILRIARQLNDAGIFFPIWGTCLGMELLVVKMADNKDKRSGCKSIGVSLPLEFKHGYQQSRLFKNASKVLITSLSQQNITYNNHHYCITQQGFNEPPLSNSWRIMSINHDDNNVEFVSSIEHLNYPFYGVQFHPEKPLYEFVSASVSHTANAVHASQYFANFFVNEARQSPHKYGNLKQQAKQLIYNYQPVYTSRLGAADVQQYLFGKHNKQK